jgi:dienelactone hydrolase
LIAHSHGLLDYRTGEIYLAQHLASWGYVVASADFPLTNLAKLACIRLADVENQPADVSFVIDSVLAEFGSAIDVDRIGASGLSFGGTTTLLVTYHPEVRDPRIKAALPIAPGACMVTKPFFATTDAPMLLVAGTSDVLVPYRQNAKRPFQAARAPKYLVSLRRASHTGFAGPLVGHPGTPHPDGIGCDAIDDVVPDDPDSNADPFAGLEGDGTGVVSTPKRCPLPCRDDDLPASAMPPALQQDLTKIAASRSSRARSATTSARAAFSARPSRGAGLRRSGAGALTRVRVIDIDLIRATLRIQMAVYVFGDPGAEARPLLREAEGGALVGIARRDETIAYLLSREHLELSSRRWTP